MTSHLNDLAEEAPICTLMSTFSTGLDMGSDVRIIGAPTVAIDLDVAAADAAMSHLCSPRWLFHDSDWRTGKFTPLCSDRCPADLSEPTSVLDIAGPNNKGSLSALREDLLHHYDKSGSGSMVWLFFLRHNRSVPLVLLR